MHRRALLAGRVFGAQRVGGALGRDPPATLTGANRAIEVSFDRPYSQPTEGAFAVGCGGVDQHTGHRRRLRL